MWKDGRSRWDLLDVVRLTRALRPEGINWPVTSDGKPTNRLELITKLNGISHESAHDALSDVNALIDVARLVRKHQPKLFDYLFKLRDKREVKALINPEKPNPFVYASGRYGSQHNFTTVAVPLFATKQGGCVVFDLRYNLTELLDSLAHPDQPPKSNRLLDQLFPHVKELGFNKCPAVAPLSVLNTTDTWQKIDLSRQTIDANLAALHRHPEIITKLKQEFSAKSADFTGQSIDAESSLYDSFIPDLDRPRMAAVREGDADSLADFHPNFTDERLPELLLHYKAKNFPTSLTANETAKWQTYRSARLSRQAPLFIQELNRFAADPDVSSHPEKSYLLEELKLWYESLQDIDYYPQKSTMSKKKRQKPTTIYIRFFEGDPNLASRAATKKCLARLIKYKKAQLDFLGVTTLNPNSADELFRAFVVTHPEIELVFLNLSPEVQAIANHARGLV